MMLRELRPAVVLLVIFTALTGLFYPLALTGAAQGLFPVQANGSLVARDGVVVGSALIGQGFAGPGYLHGRPSLAGAGYDAALSGASNLGPVNAGLLETVAARAGAYRALNGEGPVPMDAVTASASGLDPHISPENAARQAARVALARGVEAAAVRAAIDAETQGRWLGLFGQPRVNVLAVNRALDETLPMPPSAANP